MVVTPTMATFKMARTKIKVIRHLNQRRLDEVAVYLQHQDKGGQRVGREDGCHDRDLQDGPQDHLDPSHLIDAQSIRTDDVLFHHGQGDSAMGGGMSIKDATTSGVQTDVEMDFTAKKLID